MAFFKKYNYSTIWGNALNYLKAQLGLQQATKKLYQVEKLDIPKPQLKFKEKVDNSETIWKPTLMYKPNSMQPLDLQLELKSDGTYEYCHPYKYELENFHPPSWQLKKKLTKRFQPLEDTPLYFIDKEDKLHDMLENLKTCSEIAVDLENHSPRSFQGITCLIQISTRDTDYIIDTLSLRSELHVLNDIFTKPTILKVFHSAEMDIIWLQRDFSLYVVNMFDTQKAAKKLEFPLSLSYLLTTCCQLNIDKNSKKNFQMSDWRKRPLTKSLLKYAREDTHYLLYIKDVLTNALIENNKEDLQSLLNVYKESTEVCKKVYAKPVNSEFSFLHVLRRKRKNFNNRQLFALKELYKLRFEVARRDDESENHVLSNSILIHIAEKLPISDKEILNYNENFLSENITEIKKINEQARKLPHAPCLEDIKNVHNKDCIDKIL
ncbi:hypothetical protein TKK_0007207 [Trichogramma kaykai]|uniref:HRDC domain-containing protein n=1 Tax=Trichogramma kaykai TaxID=54128 RepID=A0ABD2X9C3_9HYME